MFTELSRAAAQVDPPRTPELTDNRRWSGRRGIRNRRHGFRVFVVYAGGFSVEQDRRPLNHLTAALTMKIVSKYTKLLQKLAARIAEATIEK